MHSGKSAPTAGILSCVGLVCSWTAIIFGPRVIAAEWAPHVWIAALIALLCSAVLAIVATRSASKWWYLVVAACGMTIAVLLASVAV